MPKQTQIKQRLGSIFDDAISWPANGAVARTPRAKPRSAKPAATEWRLLMASHLGLWASVT